MEGDIDPEEFYKLQVPLYKNLNSEGAIMADFNEFSPAIVEVEGFKQDYERLVVVNPNYLEKNTVYDVNNNAISISEEESDYIILVPDKYKDFESSIIDRHNIIKNGYGPDSETQKQDIKIIYTKSNQNVFSYRVEINPTQGNFVTDPIIRVITEKNGASFDYTRIIGYVGDPIKIKVDSSTDAEEFIRTKLQYFGLDKSVSKISKANEGIAYETKEVYSLLISIICGLGVLFIGMILIVIQNIYCFFEQYKKQLAIRQFHGYNNIHKYKEVSILFFITWSVLFISSTFIINSSIKIQGLLTIAFMFIELILTIITIKVVNTKKIVTVIKGR